MMRRLRLFGEEGIRLQPALLLDANLPGDPLATPEVRPVAVLQFDAQLSGFLVVPLQLALHEHEPVFQLLDRNWHGRHRPHRQKRFEIVLENSNRRHTWSLEQSSGRPDQVQIVGEQFANVVNAQRHHRHAIKPQPPGNDRHRHARAATSLRHGTDPAPPSSIHPRRGCRTCISTDGSVKGK